MSVGRRIAVVGLTGSGKSTTGAQIASRLGLTFIELDAINWLPGWREKTPEQFRADLKAALHSAPEGWVVAGNYRSKTQGMVLHEADTVIWLRLPFRVSFWQLFRRTLHRSWTREPLWGTTNRESWRRSLLSRHSILLWGITSRNIHRTMPAVLREGAPHAEVIILRSSKEVRTFVSAL